MNSENIDFCFQRSFPFQLNLDTRVFSIDGMSGKAFRCFLCELPNKCYLEIGTCKGLTLFSATNNTGVYIGIDNFSQ